MCLLALTLLAKGEGPADPPICTSLPARLASPDGRTLSPEDETKVDTSRIQQALDRCGAGKAVELAADGKRQAFLSGALQLRAGVTLLLEGRVVLLASREARDFQVSPGRCGVVDDKGGGCKPLLSCRNAEGGGIQGGGTIDGRSDAPILGETFSWDELQQEARLRNGKVNAPALVMIDGCRNITLARVSMRNAAVPAIQVRNSKSILLWHISRERASVETSHSEDVRVIKPPAYEEGNKRLF